jgi:FixJ family two-component response regulator
MRFSAMDPTVPDDGHAAEAGGNERPVVHIVDDDASVRTALARLLDSAGYDTDTFESAEAFLAGHDPHAHGCVVLDVAMPGQGGIALQRTLAEHDDTLPIVFLSGCTDVAICAGAMKSGALDFLPKPVQDVVLLEAVARALELDRSRRVARARRARTEARLGLLTPREREVLSHVVAGRLNKQIAADLGTAEKTIKVHRARGMEKMQVRCVADLVRMVERDSPEGFAPGT